MKKIICVILTIVIATLTLVSCSSTITPTSTPSWTDGEILSYKVRKASDYELSIVNIDSSYQQVLPAKANGYYTTRITHQEDDTYRLDALLNVVETYTAAEFGNDTALLEKIKTLANANPDDALSVNGEDIIVNLISESTVIFNKTTFLPISSTKTIQNAVFIHATMVNGKKYDGQCEINNVTLTTTYDYSAKTPKVTVKNGAAEETIKLKKTSSLKTYDNEQLVFLLRSFSLDTLKSNLSTPITIFDAMQNQPLSLSITVSSNPDFTYQIGGVFKGIDDNGVNQYYQTADETQYTDTNGKVIETIERPVSQVYLSTGGKPIYYYFDNKNREELTFKNALIRMQQGHLVFDIDEQSLATL